MKLLAVDTTSPWGSVALLDAGSVLVEERLDSETKGHSRTVLPAIEFVLQTAGIELEAVEAYGVAVGPGSFTGIRVGISTVQGLALTGGRPCLGVTTLDALAAKITGEAECLVSVVDAFRGEVYGALYDREGRRTREPAVEAPQDLLAQLPAGNAAFVGDGVPLIEAKLASFAGAACFPRCDSFLAAALGKLAGNRIVAGEGETPGALRPVYVRPPYAKLPSR